MFAVISTYNLVSQPSGTNHSVGPVLLAAHSNKCNKYAGIFSDIESNGKEIYLLCIENGACGYVSKDN